jgi:hypothetical protein
MNAHIHPCLEWKFEHMIAAFERAKALHDLDRAVTVIGLVLSIFLHLHVCLLRTYWALLNFTNEIIPTSAARIDLLHLSILCVVLRR